MENLGLPEGKKIIVFDGVCNLCNRFVQYVIKNDKKDVFRFVAMQSELGKKIIKKIGLDPKHSNSVILYQPGIAYYYKSAAVNEIANNLGSYFSALRFYSILPAKLGDFVYDRIAKNRYKIYGRSTNCMIPTPTIKKKFLE